MPGVDVRARHLEEGDLPSEDAAPSSWVEELGAQPEDTSGFVVLPEPFTFPADRLLTGLDYAYPHAPKVGGLVSGARQPDHHALFLDRHTHHSGALVVGLGGAVTVDTRVAQGCKPFGRVGRITAADGYDLSTIDGKPAGAFLQEQLRNLDGHDLELAKTTPLFLGIAMDPFALDAPQPGDFLIRNVLDYDPESGRLKIGEHLSVGRAVQFHLRDHETSSNDLREVLTRTSPGTRARKPAGALLFSCLGRGKHLYGEEGHDSRVFTETIGDVPLGGFFCNGEIGPVLGTTHLHGFTSAFALLSAKSTAQQ